MGSNFLAFCWQALKNQVFEAQAKLEARVGFRSQAISNAWSLGRNWPASSPARHNRKPRQRQGIGQRDVTWTTAQRIMQGVDTQRV